MAPSTGFLLLIGLMTMCVQAVVKLPNTSGIDGELTARLGVDHFFSLWLVFNNDVVKTSDAVFTIFAPQNLATKRAEALLQEPEKVKRLVMDHVVLGSRIDLTNVSGGELTFKTLGGRTVHVRPVKEGKNGTLQANDAKIVERNVVVPNGILVVLDNYLFKDEESLVKENATTATATMSTTIVTPTKTVASTAPSLSRQNFIKSNTTFVENILEILSFLKSGVRVFQHFLSRSNVSQLLKDGEEYTVFVPTDHAFQRWHPIDWGFYPFSVPEFTETIIVNHFIKGRLKQDAIKDGQTAKTLGGREITFKKTPNLSVNQATVVKGDTPVSHGNIMFIGEVLFVSEAVVSKLHQQHRDKETPPLLAFPWFGAQFLSHAFLALERDTRFSHITRFLNLADLAPHVSGTGYTFFVPTDTAFQKLGLDKMPDNYLSTGEGLQILLNHFVKGRLYDKDLKDGTQLQTLGNRTISIARSKETVKVNEGNIVESQIFVYNLGTMYYIDKVLFTNNSNSPVTTPANNETPKNITNLFASTHEIEKIPEELREESGALPDVLVSDGAATSDNETAIFNLNITHNETIK